MIWRETRNIYCDVIDVHFPLFINEPTWKLIKKVKPLSELLFIIDFKFNSFKRGRRRASCEITELWPLIYAPLRFQEETSAKLDDKNFHFDFTESNIYDIKEMWELWKLAIISITILNRARCPPKQTWIGKCFCEKKMIRKISDKEKWPFKLRQLEWGCIKKQINLFDLFFVMIYEFKAFIFQTTLFINDGREVVRV